MKAVLCLIAIVAFASATSMLERYPTAFTMSKKRSIMNVMVQVEAHLKANGPMDAITRILNEFEQEINAEQLAADQLYERQTAECEDEFAFRLAEIAEAQAAITEATETLQGAQQQLARAKSDLAITKKQIKEKTAELLNVHTVRKREKYAFDTNQGVFAIVHPAIADALEYLDALAAGEVSFVQISRHMNKMLVNCAQLGQAHHMAPVMGALAQLAASEVIADSALIERLRNMFLTFQAKLEEENAAQIAAEEAAIVKYEADVARIEGIIANLQQQQADLEEEIASLDKVIITQQNIISTATLKEERNQRLYDDAVRMCHAMDVQYANQKAARAAELELLAAIQVKVEEHYANIASDVHARGALDNFDNTYTNASEYDHQEFQA